MKYWKHIKEKKRRNKLLRAKRIEKVKKNYESRVVPRGLYMTNNRTFKSKMTCADEFKWEKHGNKRYKINKGSVVIIQNDVM